MSDTVYKYILCPTTEEEELYNIRYDPEERRNLMGDNEVIESFFKQQLSF